MTRSNVIIAAIAVNLLFGCAFGATTEALAPTGFAAYQVRLEITRNGVALGSPESTLARGESASLELIGGARQGNVLVQQRVTGFPGAGDYKALLELELYGPSRSGSQRIVAPTFGIELGRSQLYEMRTEQGLIGIRATVDGLATAPDADSSGIQTMAYPEI